MGYLSWVSGGIGGVVGSGVVAEYVSWRGPRLAVAKFRPASLPSTLVSRPVLYDGLAAGVEAYRFRRQLYYATCAILVSIPSSYSEGVKYPSPF